MLDSRSPAARLPLSRHTTLAGLCYLLGAFAVTLWLWRDPASRTVAGNPNDADQMLWFCRYSATAIAHLHLPALVTTATNAPRGVNVMWNPFMLLLGVLLTPVTLLAGPQVSITVLVTAGFAGSALAMFVVLRRWDASMPAAALGGFVYGFSPAVLHSAIAHYNLQFIVLPPLIADVVMRLAAGRVSARRGGDGMPAAGLYLNQLWNADAPVNGVGADQMRAQLAAWQVTAVVAVTTPDSALAQYLSTLLGRPRAAEGGVIAWRAAPPR